MRLRQYVTLICIVFLTAALAGSQSTDGKKYAVGEGKVTNAASGEPVVRAMVTIRAVGQKPADPENDDPGFATETDDTGGFYFARLPAGKYNLFADKPGFLRANYGAHRADGPGVPIELVADETRSGLDIKMQPEAVVSGTVTDDRAEPGRSCMVQLMRRGWMYGRSTLVANGSSTTDSEGNFRIAEVRAGRYYLRADCLPDYRNFGRQPILVDRAGNVIKARPVATYFGDSTTVDGATLIAVQSGQELSGENIRLRREAVYHVHGKVASLPQGEAAVSYRIFLSPRTTGNFYGMGASTKVKRDGSFELDDIPAGTYQLSAWRGNHLTPIPTLLEVSGDIDNLETVIPAPVQLHGRFRIEGQPSTPLTAISLHLIGSSGMYGGAADVAADGSFKLENVTLDQYGIGFEYPGETAFVKSVRVGDKEMPGKSLDLTQGAGPIEIVVSLNPAKLDVSVTKQGSEADQQLPAEAVNVVLIPEVRSHDWLGGVVWGSTDNQGLYTFKDLPPGKYQAFAAEGLDMQQWADPEIAKALGSHAVAFEIQEKESKEIQVKLIPADEVNQLLEKLGL